MKTALLGTSGFIGGKILELLKADKSFRSFGFSSATCNLLDAQSINSAFDGMGNPDAVVFASAITRLTANTYEAMLKNIAMAQNLIARIREKPLKKLVFLSSIDVYGTRYAPPLTEASPLDPADYYALSKATSELMLRSACRETGIDLLVMRLSGIYGPGDHGKSTVNTLVRSALIDKLVRIFGDGGDTRDFVYADDLFEIIRRFFLGSAISELTVNAGTGVSFTIREIVGLIREISGRDFAVEYVPKKDNSRVSRIEMDVALLKKSFPGIKMTMLAEGLRNYLESFRSG